MIYFIRSKYAPCENLQVVAKILVALQSFKTLGRTKTKLKGENARELLKENFKLDIPVEDLHRVMIGLPRGKVIYDNLGYAKEALVEDQYKVIYRSYKPTSRSLELIIGIDAKKALHYGVKP